MEDARIVRFVKFHGYLFLAVALSLVIRELWAVTLVTFEHGWTPGCVDCAIRGHPAVRWVFVMVWLAVLAFMYGGMAWEDGAYLQPAKFVFVVELGALLVRDLIVTIQDDPQGRFILDLNYLFFVGVFVVYVLYSFYALRTLFAVRNQRLGMKSIDARLAIVNMRNV